MPADFAAGPCLFVSRSDFFCFGTIKPFSFEAGGSRLHSLECPNIRKRLVDGVVETTRDVMVEGSGS